MTSKRKNPPALVQAYADTNGVAPSSRSKTPAVAIDAGMALMRLADKREALELEIRTQVHQVLSLGGSWTTVSVALGTTRQAAWERYR